MTPPPPSAAPRRVRTVPVAALLAAVIGGFLWGLALFAVGRSSAPRSDDAHHAVLAALAQLNRLDQALAARDAVTARDLYGRLSLPSDATWVTAAALRAQTVVALERQEHERVERASAAERLARRLHRLCDAGLEFIELTASPGQGDELIGLSAPRQNLRATVMRSRDGGHQWTKDERFNHQGERLPLFPGLRHHPATPQSLLVIDPLSERRLGWLSRDGGGTISEIPRPPKAGEPTGEEQIIVAGDGALVLGLPSGAHPGVAFAQSRDGGQRWQPGAQVAELLLMQPTASGSLIVARGDAQQVLVSSDGGLSFREAEADTRRLFPGTGAAAAQVRAVADRFAVAVEGGWSLIDGEGHAVGPLSGLPAGDGLAALIAHPTIAKRWYALLRAHGLLRSDDGGRSWRQGEGALATLVGGCLAFTAGEHPALLIGGDGVWRFDDGDETEGFAAAAGAPEKSAR